MRSEEEIQLQRKKAKKTAFILFLVVILIVAIYASWFNTWIVNKVKAKESLTKDNNLTPIEKVEPKSNGKAQ